MIFQIFSPKNLAKILAFFAQTTASYCKNCDHNIGFWEKRQFFRWKLAKIAENSDHNIDPRLKEYKIKFPFMGLHGIIAPSRAVGGCPCFIALSHFRQAFPDFFFFCFNFFCSQFSHTWAFRYDPGSRGKRSCIGIKYSAVEVSLL
jgi:hypothetical protein